jgi:hypothetical protein
LRGCARPSGRKYGPWSVKSENSLARTSRGGIITRWTPIKNLTFSADLAWTHLDQKYSGTVTPAATLAVPAKPAATYDLKDQDSIVLLLRAQRNW